MSHERNGNQPAAVRDRRVVTAAEFVPELGIALARVKKDPSAENHRAAGDCLRDQGILDHAHDEYSHAVQLKPSDAAAWEGLARIWRDWGFPHLALPHAHRAVYHARGSATTHNTVGTILQALRQGGGARREFELALALDPGAAYALNNLCYSWISEADAVRALDACGKALVMAPGLKAARNNMALAHAIAGDMAAARGALSVCSSPGRTEYTLGVLFMAQRRYAEAATAFDRAKALDPDIPAVVERALQAHTLAVRAPEKRN